MAHYLQVFKFLFALAKEVESFIEICCRDAWIQAAVFMTNVSKHVSSIGFNLEVFSILFSRSNERNGARALTLTEVACVSKAVVETVEEEASVDASKLLMKLESFSQSSNISNENEWQLAIFLLERLGGTSSPNLPESSPSNLSERFFTNLEQMESLGRGATAIVHKAIWLGAIVAKKTFIGPNNSDFKKELSILGGLSHPNIIRLFGYGKQKHTCFFVMEVMDGDLFSLILKRLAGDGTLDSPFTILEGVDIMLQIAEGMLYLHQNRIVHRDLKSYNILVRCVKARGMEIEYVHAKVADFGLSKVEERSSTFSNQTPNMGTARWMAPEMIKFLNDDNQAKTLSYPYKSDVYSFGMVCYEILSGHLPFSSIENPKEVKKMVLNGDRPQLPDHCPFKLRNLIERCWRPDPSRRPSFCEICDDLRYLKCLLLKRRSDTIDPAKSFSLSEVTIATENFNTEIGRVRFGRVWYGKLPDGQEVSVMVADDSTLRETEFLNLVETVSRVHHRNLVAFLGYCLEQNKKILLYECMKNGSLSDRLYGNAEFVSVLDWTLRLRIALSVAQGLEYMHKGCSPPVIHCDAKSRIILLTLNFEVKLTGFGLTKFLSDAEAAEVRAIDWGAADYFDPEFVIEGFLPTKSDVYSFGVVLLELITGRVPLDRSNPREEYRHVRKWVRDRIARRDIDTLLDPAVRASHPNYEAVQRVVEIAFQSVAPRSVARPSMTKVVQVLQDVVAMEEQVKTEQSKARHY